MAAHADLTNLKAKLATQDSEVASMRNELDLAAREAQELNTKQVELVSQVRYPIILDIDLCDVCSQQCLEGLDTQAVAHCLSSYDMLGVITH